MFMIKNKIVLTPEEEFNKLDNDFNNIVNKAIKFKEKKYNYLNEAYKKKFNIRVEYLIRKAKETIK